MLKSEVPTTRGFGTSAAFSAIERLLPYHACYEPGADADDSAAHLDTVSSEFDPGFSDDDPV